MALMAIDHASAFIARVHFTEIWGVAFKGYPTMAWWFTRFVSHLCAPGFFFLINFIRGLKEPILNDYINRYTSSEMRATILSIKSFFIRGVFAIFGPLVGWMLDIYSFAWAMGVTCAILFIFGIYIIFMLSSANALKN